MMAGKFEITRAFAASRLRLWEAWTNPLQFAAWLGPRGVKTEVLHFDLRPGGYLHSRVEAPDGSISWARNTYLEIDPPNRIVWRQGWANAAAEIVPPPFPMPLSNEMQTTVQFADVDGATQVTLTWTPIDPTPEQAATFDQLTESMTGGWTGTFDQLDAFLAGEDAGAS
jgi:uncharacterized protein YndB with AHSA1/START domain